MTAPKRPDPLVVGAGIARRVIDAVAPGPDGSPPPAVANLGARWVAALSTVIGFSFGAVVGLLAYLSWRAFPGVAPLLLGLVLGVLVGGALSLVLASRVAAARARGGWAPVLLPLVFVAAPLLLLGSAWEALRRKSPRSSRKRSGDRSE